MVHVHIAHHLALVCCAVAPTVGLRTVIKVSGWWELGRGLMRDGAPLTGLLRPLWRRADAWQAVSRRIGATRRRVSKEASSIAAQVIFRTCSTAGPRMTMKSTGRKKTIIGTVSFGGRAAAFFSASDIRMSRFSLAMTRCAWLTGVP